MARYSHILLPTAGEAERYTAAQARGPRFQTPPRNRAQHAARILGAFDQARTARPQFPQQIGNGFYDSPGFTLTFESEPGFPLAFESLDLPRSSIELLSVVKDEQDRTLATIYVPDDKIQVLLNKLEAYRDFNLEAPRRRDNRKLVESISNIKLATLREMWTDDPALYPAANTIITWEVWLRRELEGQTSAVAILTNAATDLGYEVISNALSFVDRIVILVRGRESSLRRALRFLGYLPKFEKRRRRRTFSLPLNRASNTSGAMNFFNASACRPRARR